MARLTPIQTNFTAGELSPRVRSRIDIAKYNNGLKAAENLEILIHGGARGRPGSRYVAEVKDSTKAVRLIEFVFNREQAYMLEFGDQYMRVFKDGAPVLVQGVPYEIATPYTSAMLPDLAYVQGADTMFLAHPDVPVHRLQRFGDASWRMLAAAFTVEPFDELGHTPAAALTLSAATVGAGRTFTSAGQFLPADVGRDIVAGAGLATITAYTDANNVTAEIKSAFSGTAIASGAWTVTISPQATLAVGVAPTATLTLDSAAVGTGRTATSTGQFKAADVGREIYAGAAMATITGFVDANSVKCEIKTAFSGTSIAAGDWIMTVESTPGVAVGSSVQAWLASAGWRAADVGRFVKFNGGLIQLTSVTSGIRAVAEVKQAPTSGTGAIPNSWTLNASVWNGSSKYPRAVTLYEQRLQLAGSPGYSQTVWGSRIGDVLNFEPGTKDDDAYAYEVSTSQIAPIQHLANASRLMVFTNFNEMSIRGGVEKPITPTSLQKKDESTAGANRVRPVKVGNELIFVQRAGKKVRAMGYRYDIDGFDAPDRTVFSEHITGPGITDMAFQQEPEAQLYCVRSDGQMAVCAYNVDQDVIAWGRWITSGVYESVASIPTSASEQTWTIVRRTVGGVQKRFIEVFDQAVKTDCAVTASAGTATATWSGLGHLEGRTVQAVADGVYQGEFTVTGGAVTLPRAALAVEFGLGYVARMTLLNPEVGSPGATSQGAAISVGEVIVRVLDTSAVTINGQVKTFRRMDGELLDRPPAIGSGDLREITLSDQLYRNELTIEQSSPMDFHVLAVIRKCTVND